MPYYLLIIITLFTGEKEILNIQYPSYETCAATLFANIANKRPFPAEVKEVNYLCVSVKST